MMERPHGVHVVWNVSEGRIYFKEGRHLYCWSLHSGTICYSPLLIELAGFVRVMPHLAGCLTGVSTNQSHQIILSGILRYAIVIQHSGDSFNF
jgi:hypothetical protein